MKIDRSSLHGPTAPRRSEKARGSSDGGFAAALDGGGAAAKGGGVAAGGQVGGLDALLALQEVSDTPVNREEMQRRGHRILDRLDELRLDLLEGRLSSRVVERLAAEVEAARGDSDDPRLNEILDDIELRAQVELAKLGR